MRRREEGRKYRSIKPVLGFYTPKGGIGKNETVGFLVPNELKGGGTEISKEIS